MKPTDFSGREAGASPFVKLVGRRRWLALVLGCGALWLAGCEKPAPARMPNPLRVGVLPEQESAKLETLYAPLVNYLGETLGVRAELVIPPTYEDLMSRFHRGELDLVLLGGVTFVQAEQQDGANPLVRRMIDRHITSVVIARSGLAGKFPDDFRGRSFAYGSKVSTSGFMMPKYFFRRMDFVPETFFGSVTNLTTHDAVLNAVAKGQVDVGVLGSQVLRSRIQHQVVDPKLVRTVWESPPYTDHVWAAAPRLSNASCTAIRNAFLQLDAANPAHKKIMSPMGARAYVPATREDFDLIRDIVTGNPTYSPP